MNRLSKIIIYIIVSLNPRRPLHGGVSTMHQRGGSLQLGSLMEHPSNDGRWPRRRHRGGGEFGGTELYKDVYNVFVAAWKYLCVHVLAWHRRGHTVQQQVFGLLDESRIATVWLLLLAQWQNGLALIEYCDTGDFMVIPDSIAPLHIFWLPTLSYSCHKETWKDSLLISWWNTTIPKNKIPVIATINS